MILTNKCGGVARSEMGRAHQPLLSATSTKRPRSTCCVLMLMMSIQIINHVSGSTLCDRCETEEVRALRRYSLSLNLSSKCMNAITIQTHGVVRFKKP